MKTILFISLLFIMALNSVAQSEYQYTIPDVTWEEGFGNHRAIIDIASDTEVARLNLLWRRHDKGVAQKRFILINAGNNQQVNNIYRRVVNNENCEIFFGPVTAGRYYFYFLPYVVDEGWGYFSKDYLPVETAPNQSWVSNNNIPNLPASNYVEAVCSEIQARTEFDSFYPMEVIATQQEKNMLMSSSIENYLLFPESRSYPIRMLDNIPQRWIINPHTNIFTGIAERNEYFVFQVGLWAAKDNISDVTVTFSDLSDGGNTIPSSAITCFNTGGIAPSGKPFTKILNVDKGKTQALWMGVDISKETLAGIYTGKVTINTANSGEQDIEVVITVTDSVLTDRGDNELWRHSRLRWLNSTAGIDDTNPPQYQPIQNIDGGALNLSGKAVSFSQGGLPSTIRIEDEELLAAPITFSILTAAGNLVFSAPTSTLLTQATGVVSKKYEQTNVLAKLTTTSIVESDGWINYSFEIEATQNLNISDIKLEIPYNKVASTYMMGMVPDGQKTPENLTVWWRTNPRFDSFWLGSASIGLHCELRGADYTGPMINWYSTPPPETWYNNNRGRLKINTSNNVRTVTVTSGSRYLRAGSKINFECAFLITPVKKIDTNTQFSNRYYHNPGPPMPGYSALAEGINVTVAHHGSSINPYINYPFIATENMKTFVDELHSKNVKTKIYYTILMLSNHATEIWALRSLGTEVFTGGGGAGHPWLREHLIENYEVKWFQPLDDLNVCNGLLLSTKESRLYNYYIEGLKWLVDNIDIDGIYLDDVAFGRDMLKRIHKVVADKKPNFMIDLHSHRGATGTPALQYTEIFPYIDKLWFGEAFNYNQITHENWLVETSGIPFGLMGDMLQDGGNTWRGLVYGMTTRFPWSGYPKRVWELFDDFGIADSRMIGYWDKNPVVTTSSNNVLATAYIKNKKMLICLASWEPTSATVNFNIDVTSAGLTPENARVNAPRIVGLQADMPLNFNSPITIDFRGGRVLLVDEDPSTNIDEHMKVSHPVKVYPSIITDKFTVEGDLSSNVSIKNIFGGVVYNQVMNEKLEVDASAWPAGIYIVVVQKGAGGEVIKVVKI